MTLQTTSWLNLLPFTIGCLLILGFIGYAAYRGQAHIKRFPLRYASGLLLVLLVGISLIRTAAKPTTIADTELGKTVTLYDKTQNLDEFLTLELKNDDKTIKASTENIPSDFIKRVRSTDKLTKVTVTRPRTGKSFDAYISKKDFTEIKPYSTTGKATARVVSSLTYRPMTLDLTKLGLHKEEQSYRLKLVVLYVDKEPSKALDAIFTND
jgi:hypothetical protein